jgi:TRAP-type uncharacterized transport system fused permease subunit
MVMVALACAVTMTGVVISFSSVVTSVSGGNVLFAGVLLALTTLVLGMGVPTTAAYIIGASIGAPILQQMGVPPLAAHMFVFYFSILADATPPVSVASYAAASIAKCNPMHAGAAAFRMGLAGFVVGFSYLHSQALLMVGPWPEITGEFLVCAVSLTLVAAALSGFLRRPLPLWLSVLLVPVGVALALGDAIAVQYRLLIAILILAGIVMWQGRTATPVVPVAP